MIPWENDNWETDQWMRDSVRFIDEKPGVPRTICVWATALAVCWVLVAFLVVGMMIGWNLT